MLGALNVPLRISRSCPPPCKIGSISKPRFKIKAATPSGPPTLWALIVAAVNPSCLNESSTLPKLCTQSAWTGIWPAIFTTWAISCTVPTSLFECMIEIKAILPSCSLTACFNSSKFKKPFRSTLIPTI